jgi:hypothetical protein
VDNVGFWSNMRVNKGHSKRIILMTLLFQPS